MAAREKLQSLWSTPSNVGPEQLARSILILCEGSLEKMEALFANTFGGDPRDLIVAAMNKSRNSAHWGLAQFAKPMAQKVTDINTSDKAARKLGAIAKAAGLPCEVVEYLFAFHWNMDGHEGTWVYERDLEKNGDFYRRYNFLFDAFMVHSGALSRADMIAALYQKLEQTDEAALLRDFIAGAAAKDYGRVSQFATYWYLRNATEAKLATLDGPAEDYKPGVLLYNIFLKLFRGGAIERYRLDYVYADLVHAFPPNAPSGNAGDWLRSFLDELAASPDRTSLSGLRALLKKHLKGDRHFLQTVLEALSYAGYLKVHGHPIADIFIPDHRNKLSPHGNSNEWTYPLRFW